MAAITLGGRCAKGAGAGFSTLIFFAFLDVFVDPTVPNVPTVPVTPIVPTVPAATPLNDEAEAEAAAAAAAVAAAAEAAVAAEAAEAAAAAAVAVAAAAAAADDALAAAEFRLGGDPLASAAVSSLVRINTTRPTQPSKLTAGTAAAFEPVNVLLLPSSAAVGVRENAKQHHPRRHRQHQKRCRVILYCSPCRSCRQRIQEDRRAVYRPGCYSSSLSRGFVLGEAAIPKFHGDGFEIPGPMSSASKLQL